MDVLHQVLSRVERLLTLINLLSVEIDFSLYAQGVLVEQLLLLVGLAACVASLLINVVGGDALDLSISPELCLDIFGNEPVFFFPSVEVSLHGLRFLIPLPL